MRNVLTRSVVVVLNIRIEPVYKELQGLYESLHILENEEIDYRILDNVTGDARADEQ